MCNGQPCALKGAFVTQQSVAGDYEREVSHFYANITNSDSTMVIREIDQKYLKAGRPCIYLFKQPKKKEGLIDLLSTVTYKVNVFFTT